MNAIESQQKQLESINSEIQRLNARLKQLREVRKSREEHLLKLMKMLGIDRIPGYTKEKLEKKYTPKMGKKRSLSERKELTLDFFRKTGIPDPDQFLANYKAIQKPFI